MKRRQWGLGLGATVAILALVWAGRSAVETRRSQAALEQARREVVEGDFRSARSRLHHLMSRPDVRDEAQYLLGICEASRGDSEAALAAWSRVCDRSARAPAARLKYAQTAIEQGRFADAERALEAGLRCASPETADFHRQFAQLRWREGRFDEVGPPLQASWEALERLGALSTRAATDLLRAHIALDFETFPVDEILADLARAATLAPNDHRVRLARARWAIRAGRLDEAERLLGELREGHDDPVAWRTRLDWALEAGRADRVWKAMDHLPSVALSETKVLAIRAWLAARRGDEVAERELLERRLTADPGNIAVVARLAELSARQGRADVAATLRRRQAELDLAEHRYRRLFQDNDLEEHAAEMAHLAETLGRRFEARGFLTLLLRRNPDDEPSRAALTRMTNLPACRSEPATPPRRTLAELIEQTEVRPVSAGRRSAVAGPNRPGALPHFRDDAPTARLAVSFDSGRTPIHQLPEVMSGGVGLLDADGDGWLDVYSVQGGPFPPDPSARSRDRLFRNRGDGTFEDVSGASGVAGMPGGYGFGVAVGDFDNDGRPDLFVTRWRSYALYRNLGGTFADVTAEAGLGGDRDWPTSAAWADLDGDGDLDLYVCHYLKWDAAHPRLCPNPSKPGAYVSCHPRHFDALPDHVFRNDGGRFVDVSDSAGLADRDGRGLGVVAADLDGDGKTDLFVANDGSANFLYRNVGGFRFEEIAHASGVAGNASGGYQAGMGIACGDLDGDGRPDLAVTNFYGESTTFFQNLGGCSFGDRTAAVGLAAPSRSRLGFGVALLDTTNDGRLDLLTANGHVSDFRPQFPYRMPVQLLKAGPAGRLTDVTDQAGPPFQVDRLGRGLAAGDLDNDGRLDALVVGLDAPLAYFHNQTDREGHFVTLRLEGHGSNRDAVGARVTVDAGGRRLQAQRFGGGSYLSAGDPRLHFGLGDARVVEQIEVHWPSGTVDCYRNLPGDTGYRLREGDAQAHLLDGFGTMPGRTDLAKPTSEHHR